jgi:beta-glucosidase
MSGDMASESSLELPGRQLELLDAVVATGTPVVLLLMSGRPLDLRRAVEQAPAIMMLWHPGTMGGPAVANLLFGDAVPGGKLPFSWVRHVGQIPTFYSHSRSMDPERAQIRYWNDDSTPLFPFGYGLSFSGFEFGNLRLDRQDIMRGGDQCLG